MISDDIATIHASAKRLGASLMEFRDELAPVSVATTPDMRQPDPQPFSMTPLGSTLLALYEHTENLESLVVQMRASVDMAAIEKALLVVNASTSRLAQAAPALLAAARPATATDIDTPVSPHGHDPTRSEVENKLLALSADISRMAIVIENLTQALEL